MWFAPSLGGNADSRTVFRLDLVKEGFNSRSSLQSHRGILSGDTPLLKIGKDVRIHETARVNVDDGVIGDRSVVGPNVTIEGRCIRIGREAWINQYAQIGGGSCFDPGSSLEVGDFLHMGKFSFLNQARGISIGHEFGCGIATRVFTHGSYESAWDGFPVQWGGVTIGDRVWLPYALVNPGVRIGSNVVVASMSVVTNDLPSGCFAGGVPCRVIRPGIYPRELSPEEKRHLFEGIFQDARAILLSRIPRLKEVPSYTVLDDETYKVQDTVIDIRTRRIEGPSTEFTEVLKNQLRRNGIRFRYYNNDGFYVKW